MTFFSLTHNNTVPHSAKINMRHSPLISSKTQHSIFAPMFKGPELTKPKSKDIFTRAASQEPFEPVSQSKAPVAPLAKLNHEEKIERLASEAAKWWTQKLKRPTSFNNGETDGASIANERAAKRRHDDEQRLLHFEELLTQSIQRAIKINIIKRDEPWVNWKADYHPNPILQNACDQAGLNYSISSRFPSETCMEVGFREGTVSIRGETVPDGEKTIYALPKNPLLQAIDEDNADQLKALLESDPSLREESPITGQTPLITAAWLGKTEALQALINAGADLNASDYWGDTALSLTANNGDLKSLAKLIEADAKLEPKHPTDYSALIRAAQSGKLEAVKFLHRKRANINQTTWFLNALSLYEEKTPLSEAAKFGQKEIVQYLLNSKEIDVKKHGKRAVWQASHHPDIVKLIENHPDYPKD